MMKIVTLFKTTLEAVYKREKAPYRSLSKNIKVSFRTPSSKIRQRLLLKKTMMTFRSPT